MHGAGIRKDAMPFGTVLLAGGIGYLLGAIPFGVMVARLHGGVDLTAMGSGRTGATNVLRTLGRGPAALVFAGDFLKGAAAALIAGWLSGGDAWAQLAGAMGAVIGHSYSPFIAFRGGRGVVPGLAATAIAAPLPMLATATLAIVIIGITRYVSLGSVLGALFGAALMVWSGMANGVPALAAWGLLIGGFIVIAHRDNIQRLLAGTERRLGQNA